MTCILEYEIPGLGNVLKSIDIKKRKVKHPINERTGKPLSQKTIRNYKSTIKGLDKFSKEMGNAIDGTLIESKSISIDTLLEMSRFVLSLGGEVAETHYKFILLAFGAELERRELRLFQLSPALSETPCSHQEGVAT